MARICGEAAQPCPRPGGWPRPSPERGERCHGHGQRGAGRDGMAGVYCGSGLRWVGCGEEKAHTDLTGAASPHPNKRQSRWQQPPVLGALPAASVLRASGAPVLPGRMGRFAWLCQAGAKLPERSCIPLNSLSTNPQTQANRPGSLPARSRVSPAQRSSLPCPLPSQATAGPRPPRHRLRLPPAGGSAGNPWPLRGPAVPSFS